MSAGLQAFGQAASALFLSSGRSIGPFIPHVVVEEQHRDASVITEFPVEVGAAITDHTYERPPLVVIRAGWSDSTVAQNGYVKQIYAQLLALKASRQLFRVSTGKRLYDGMLFEALDMVTDAHSEYTLMIVAVLKKVILTKSQTANAGGGDPSSTAQVGQGAPAGNQPVTNQGPLQGQAVSTTAFEAAYNPGSIQTPAPITGDFSIAPLSPVNMTGLSPPLEITLPQESALIPEQGLQASGPDFYRVFGGGP